MVLNKLIFEIRESLSAISDDRRIDDRYIINAININRANLLRKLIARKPHYNVSGLTQEYEIDIATVSRSVIPTCPMNCFILRSNEKVPTLVYEGTLGNWFSVKPADVLHRYMEIIEPERLPHLTFEFNVLYSVINTDYYLYFISKDNLDLKCALVSGIFEDPLEVNPDLTDYPIKQDMWAIIKPQVIQDVLPKLESDPVNNSEPDNQQVSNDRPGVRQVAQ